VQTTLPQLNRLIVQTTLPQLNRLKNMLTDTISRFGTENGRCRGFRHAEVTVHQSADTFFNSTFGDASLGGS